MQKLINISDETDVINMRKKVSKLLSKARNTSKPNKCILCGRTQTSFCNSHSVPQFILKNIAENGKVLLSSAVMDTDVIDIEDGVKGSGTFHFICNNCDGKFFREYENEENLKNKPTDKMLAEIAIKNFLLQLSKRAQEKEIYRELQREFNVYINLNYLEEINKLDVQDYTEELEFHKNIVDKNEKNGYQILFWKLVPYKVPIATQSAIALSNDLKGNTINNISDMSESVRMQFMHLVVLPLKEESIILAFYHKRDKLYRNLRHQINCISQEKVLQFLNYTIFKYTENYFISKNIQSKIETDEKLLQLGQENNGYPNFGLLNVNNNFGLDYKPISIKDIPNFLDATWSIK